MKAYGKVQPLQFVDTRVFNGIDSETPYVAGKTNLLAGTGWTLEHYPALMTRKAIQREPGISNSGVVSNGTGPVTLISYGNYVYFAGEGGFYRVKGARVAYAGALSNTDEVSMTKFKGNLASVHLIFSNGTDLKKFDGTTVSNLLPGGYPVTVNGFHITTHKNRLFCTPNRTTTLLFSALNKADDWATVGDAGSIEIDDFADNNITAIHSSGDRLLIFRDNGFFELIGTGPSNFRLIKISDQVGAVNNRSVCTINGVTYFVHYSGVYAYVPGGIPEKISTPIDNLRQVEYYGPVTYKVDIQRATTLGTDGVMLYLNTYVASPLLQQVYQYSPKVNQWIGFDNQVYMAYTVHDGEMYICYRDATVSIGPDIYVGRIKDRDNVYTYGDSYRTQPWFAFFPIMDTGTLGGKIRALRVRMRFLASGAYNIYLANNYASPYSNQNIVFTLNSNQVQASDLIYSGTDTDEYPGESKISFVIPSDKIPNSNYIILAIGGTRQFSLYDLAVEYVPIPSN